MAAAAWAPASWRTFPVAQDPRWPDEQKLEKSLAELGTLPPLVFAGEARRLRDSLGAVAEGKAFLLQAGDCAEAFDDHSADAIRDKLKIILQMAVVLTYAAGLPVVKVGRIAGQFAKPRTAETEKIDGRELPSFRGHAVNDSAFDAQARNPDPERLLRAYHQSAATLNLIRAFTKGGFADLNQIHTWNQQFVAESPEGRRYEAVARDIERALRFMAACGIDLDVDSTLHEVDFYTSHEALLLGYEEALTRRDSLTGDWYDCSAHMLWLGERTRQVDGAHAEFLSGIHNPIAVKLGPRVTASELVALCDKLDPDNQPGRLTLIARMGCNLVEEALPPLIEAVAAEKRTVVWVCDPMHGNTFTTPGGIKTRRFADILAEIRNFFATCHAVGAIPGGVHLELTDRDVTECLGGSSEVRDDHLTERYQALCDPRLNARQSLDLAFELTEMLGRY